MTGSHHIRFLKKGKVVKNRNIEAVEMNPQFSGRTIKKSALYEIYDWLMFSKKGDTITIKTELEE